MVFRFFTHNFFKNGNFFFNFCLFTYFSEKNTKKLFKVFLYAIFVFENFNLVFETVYVDFDFFDNFLFQASIHSTNFKTGLIVGLYDNYLLFFSIFENFEKHLFAINHC